MKLIKQIQREGYKSKFNEKIKSAFDNFEKCSDFIIKKTSFFQNYLNSIEIGKI